MLAVGLPASGQRNLSLRLKLVGVATKELGSGSSVRLKLAGERWLNLAESLVYWWHQGRGVAGQCVAPQTNGTASPSAIKIDPTSLPFDRSIPQSLFQL